MVNKRQFNWLVGIVGVTSTTVLGLFKAFEKSWILAIIIFSLLIIYFGYKNLKNKSEKEINKLKKKLKEKDDEILILQSDTCKECRKIYEHALFKKVSLSEDLEEDKNFSPILGIGREGEVMMHHLDDQWIYIRFFDKEQGDYLIDLIGREIYLPVSKWKISKRNEFLSYRILCPERRKKHFRKEVNILI